MQLRHSIGQQCRHPNATVGPAAQQQLSLLKAVQPAQVQQCFAVSNPSLSGPSPAMFLRHHISSTGKPLKQASPRGQQQLQQQQNPAAPTVNPKAQLLGTLQAVLPTGLFQTACHWHDRVKVPATTLLQLPASTLGIPGQCLVEVGCVNPHGSISQSSQDLCLSRHAGATA